MDKPKFKRGDKVWFLDREGREYQDQITGVLERYDGYYYEIPYKSGDFIEESKLYTSVEELRRSMLNAEIYVLESRLINSKGTLKYYQDQVKRCTEDIRSLEEQLAALKERKQREEKDGQGKSSGEDHRGS